MYARIRPHTLVLAAALAAPLAFAQQQAQLAPGQSAPQHPVRSNAPGPLLSVDFPGGTLGQFVDAVKAATTEPINVVVPADAMSVAVPRLSLKSVTPYMALQALEFINERKAWVPGPSQPGMGGAGIMNVNELQVMDLNRNDATANDTSKTFAIVYLKRDRNSAGGSDPWGTSQSTQVFSVRDLLPPEGKSGVPGLTLDQIVQPLEAALNVEAGDGGEPARLLVHKESNLVIIRGTARQATLVKQVLERLKDDADRTRGSLMPERQRTEIADELRQQYEMRLKMLENQYAGTEHRLATLRAERDKVKADKGEQAAAALQPGIDRVEASLGGLEAEISKTRLQREQVGFEAARQQREMSAGDSEVKALREQIEQLRKQLEEIKNAAKSGNSR